MENESTRSASSKALDYMKGLHPNDTFTTFKIAETLKISRGAASGFIAKARRCNMLEAAGYTIVEGHRRKCTVWKMLDPDAEISIRLLAGQGSIKGRNIRCERASMVGKPVVETVIADEAVSAGNKRQLLEPIDSHERPRHNALLAIESLIKAEALRQIDKVSTTVMLKAIARRANSGIIEWKDGCIEAALTRADGDTVSFNLKREDPA